MTEVCVRVSWEVTRACQVHLPLDDLFSPITKAAGTKASGSNGKDSLSLVESAIKCCKEWRMCYVEVTTTALPFHPLIILSICLDITIVFLVFLFPPLLCTSFFCVYLSFL